MKERKAALDNVEVELARTVIRAPMDGVVILRSVDLGQTVAASLQAPTLFTIARDLRRMQAAAAVGSAALPLPWPGVFSRPVERLADNGRLRYEVACRLHDMLFIGRRSAYQVEVRLS